MAQVLKASTTAQWPLVASFSFSWDDSMLNTSAVLKTFGDATPGAFDIFTPPPGAIVIGGVVKVETLFSASTYTVDIGDSDDTDRYTETNPIDLNDADAPASGFEQLGDHKVYAGNQAIRMTVASGGAQTAGRAHVVVSMIVPGRANENLKTT